MCIRIVQVLAYLTGYQLTTYMCYVTYNMCVRCSYLHVYEHITYGLFNINGHSLIIHMHMISDFLHKYLSAHFTGMW